MDHRALSATFALLVGLGATGCNDSGPLEPAPTRPLEGLPTSTLHVAISTDGPGDLWRDFEGYLLRVYTRDTHTLGLNDELFLAIEPGVYRLELRGLPAPCSVEGENPRTVSVGDGRVTDVSFQINCAMEPR